MLHFKIHNPDDLCKPIVSACSCPTELISSFLDNVMFPSVKTLHSYFKDTKYMLYRLSAKYVSSVPINSFSRWTSSRFTPSFLIAMASMLWNVSSINVTTLIRLAEIVLALQNISFDGEHYQQISGVAMGTKIVPSYANLFVAYVEQHIFKQYTGQVPDFLWQIHWWLLRNSIMYTCRFSEIN